MSAKPENILDCRNKKLNINGNCMEMLPVCQAMCCSMFNVDITEEEYASGRYKAHPFCLQTSKPCDNTSVVCANRKYRLKRRDDGYCVYLDEEKRLCSIHETRPQSCRDFNCKGGWKIQFDFALADKPMNGLEIKLKGEMVFIRNPLLELESIFYSKNTGKMTFVKKPVRMCGTITTWENTDILSADSDLILDIMEQLGADKDLNAVRDALDGKRTSEVPEEDLFRMILLLCKHDLAVFKCPEDDKK